MNIEKEVVTETSTRTLYICPVCGKKHSEEQFARICAQNDKSTWQETVLWLHIPETMSELMVSTPTVHFDGPRKVPVEEHRLVRIAMGDAMHEELFVFRQDTNSDVVLTKQDMIIAVANYLRDLADKVEKLKAPEE